MRWLFLCVFMAISWISSLFKEKILNYHEFLLILQLVIRNL